MRRFLLWPFLYAAFVTTASAQTTTVADFDNPPCSVNDVIGVYQGIDFSLSPWNCDNAGLSGQTGNTISWYQPVTSGRFRFQSPSVLLSFSAATSSGSGILTITTDAGESFFQVINTTFQTLQTGFRRAASVVTVQFPGGWTIELDNLTYQIGSVAPGSLTASARLTWDDGTPVSGRIVLTQITGPNTTHFLGTFPIDPTGFVTGSIAIDTSQSDPLTFRVDLLGPSSSEVAASVTLQVLKLMFPTSATGINAKIVLAKVTATIRTFDISLVP